MKYGYNAPKISLSTEIERFVLPDGRTCWSMKSEKYVKAAVATVRALLAKDGRELKTGKISHKGPLPPRYKPELDVTKELDADRVQRFQQIFGILRRAVELGRIDIKTEVALLLQYQTNPRDCHLEALFT